MLGGTERTLISQHALPMQRIPTPAITVQRLRSANSMNLIPFDETTSSQQADGLIEGNTFEHIFMIEVARTDDFPDSLLRAREEKMCEYDSLLHTLIQTTSSKLPHWCVGSINEQQWRRQLAELGINSYQQDKTIRKCIAANITGGTHAVANHI